MAPLRAYLSDVSELPLFTKIGGALALAHRQTCGGWIVQRAQRHPARTAARFEDEVVSYRALNEGTNRVANTLRQMGVGKGDVVAIVLQNSPASLMVQLAVAKLGAVGALINHHLRGSSIEHVLAAAEPRVIIDEASLGDFMTGSVAEPPKVQLRGSDVFLYIYTSGTTGLPKPAIIRHSRFTMAGVALAGMLSLTWRDCIYAPLPLYHGESNFVGFAPALYTGGTFASRRQFSARAFMDDVRRHDASMFVYVGELCRYLLAAAPSAGDRDHRLRIAAGAGLRGDIWRRFQERFGIARICEMYGSTEGNIALMNRHNKVGSVGRAQPFQHHAVTLAQYDVASGELVRDRQSGWVARCKDGEVGELLGRVGSGPMPYEGYVDREASERRLVRDAFKRGDAWFRSGDLLRRDSDGWYYFVDRSGDSFRYKGENVATQEVEAVLMAYRGISMANVYGIRLPAVDGRAGMAAITVTPSFCPRELHAHLCAHLPDYAQPLYLRVTEAMSETGTLKMRKVALQADGLEVASDPLYVRVVDTYRRVAEVDIRLKKP